MAGWLGVAQIWITGGVHIKQGTVKNNDYYFGSSSYQYNNEAEKRHVICQEVGHTLGLDHQSTSGASLNTCMDYYHNTSNTDTKSTTPNQHDYDELVTIYTHLDSTATIGSFSFNLPGNASNADLNDRREWGALISTSEGGRASTFVREFANGERMVTHVIWAQ